MNTLQQQARHLYFNEHRTQKEIAITVGVTEKTIYNWVQQFGWHQQREEEQSMTTLAANSICMQLIAFQQAIATRTDNRGVPNAVEINLQCKLINCLDKLRRHSSRQAKATYAITDFLHFVNRDDQQLGDTMFNKYSLYTQKNSSRKTANVQNDSALNIALDTSPATNEQEMQPVKTGNKPVNEPPPISEQDYKDYKHILGNFGKLADNGQIKFRGRYVNAKWLEYNLFQYTMLPAQRRFINDFNTIIKEIDHKQTQDNIKAYLTQLQRAAA